MWHWWLPLQHWLAVHTGSLNEPGVPPNYNFFSGVGSDLTEFALVGALLAMVRKHNCHVKRCPRIGRHPVEGTSFVVCRKHSPNGAPTHAEVIAAHHAAKLTRPPKRLARTQDTGTTGKEKPGGT